LYTFMCVSRKLHISLPFIKQEVVQQDIGSSPILKSLE